VSRGKASDKAIDAEATHGLVTETKAGVDIAAHDEAPSGDDLAVLVNGEHTGPERSTGAAREDAEVIGILQVLGEHDVADIKESRELGDRKVPDAPGILELIGDAGIQDEAPPWRGGLVDGPEGLDEERQRAVERHHLNDALPDPHSELGAKGDLGRLVSLPARMIRPARWAQGEAGLGHMKAPLDNGGRRGVEGAETLVPCGGRVINRHEVALRELLEFEIGGHKTGHESRSAGGDDKTSGRRRGGPGEQRL
jgi:hypothetical protein